MIFGWFPFKVVQRIPFHVEFCLPWQPKGKNTLKHLLVKNYWSDFKIIWYRWSRVTLYQSCSNYYTPHKLCLWWVYCFHVVRVCVRLSVTFCFLNILKSHCWIFIKPCKHVHICKTNALNKIVRARGQFYYSYFPL